MMKTHLQKAGLHILAAYFLSKGRGRDHRRCPPLISDPCHFSGIFSFALDLHVNYLAAKSFTCHIHSLQHILMITLCLNFLNYSMSPCQPPPPPSVGRQILFFCLLIAYKHTLGKKLNCVNYSIAQNKQSRHINAFGRRHNSVTSNEWLTFCQIKLSSMQNIFARTTYFNKNMY